MARLVPALQHECLDVCSAHLFEERSGAEKVGIPACDGLGEHLVRLLQVVLCLLHLIQADHEHDKALRLFLGRGE